MCITDEAQQKKLIQKTISKTITSISRGEHKINVLETGKAFVPVSFTSTNRNVLDSMSQNERAIVGSVRVMPRKASPIKFFLALSDLAGYWSSGIVTSTDYYNNSGQYQSNPLTAVNTDTQYPPTVPTRTNSED